MKKQGKTKPNVPYKPIHMPNNSGRPIIMSAFFFISGFGLVFQWWWMGIAGLIGVLACMGLRSFENDNGFYVSVEEIEETEKLNG